MKKLSKKQKLIILISIILIAIIIGIAVSVNVIKVNIANDKYNTANNNSSSGNLLPEYIKEGITLGGVAGTLVDLDTSDATARAEDIIAGKVAYARGERIVGTMGATSETESYVGNYADIDDDGTVDGIIFADLAIGGSGEYGNNGYGIYGIPKENNLKSYYIKNESYTDDSFKKTGKVIAPVEGTSGNDRFYIMALEDINSGKSYSWYDAASGQLDDTVAYNVNDFGEGKANTQYVNGKWKDSLWGEQNHGSGEDMWLVIQDEIAKGWFVPSKSEWAAFGAAFGIIDGNYSSFGLGNVYWSSSKYNTDDAYLADFITSTIYKYSVTHLHYIRLATTF